VKKVPHRREHRLKVGMTRGDKKKNFSHKDKCGQNDPLSFLRFYFLIHLCKMRKGKE